MMNLDTPQLPMFNFPETISGMVELFPTIWTATEELTSPDASIRSAALGNIIEFGAHRLSPLVAYLIATRITDPDIDLRFRVVQALGNVLTPDDQGKIAPESVRNHLKAYLSQMRRRSIFALLQVVDQYPESEQHVATLLNACSHAGSTLADILIDRKALLSVRQQAVNLITRVGFLDAVPTLERLASRLESRASSQSAMPFAPSSTIEETSLLPAIHKALNLFREI